MLAQRLAFSCSQMLLLPQPQLLQPQLPQSQQIPPTLSLATVARKQQVAQAAVQHCLATLALRVYCVQFFNFTMSLICYCCETESSCTIELAAYAIARSLVCDSLHSLHRALPGQRTANTQ